MSARVALIALSLTACVSLPEVRPQRGLYVDLRKAVVLQEQEEWIVDRLEVEDTLEGVMGSVCSSTRETREDLRAWLERRIATEAGEPGPRAAERMYAREGAMSSDVEDVRTLERVQMVLEAAEDVADDCPYWLEEDPAFAGRESDEARLVIFAESLGGGSVRFGGGDLAFGGHRRRSGAPRLRLRPTADPCHRRRSGSQRHAPQDG